jgi:mxaJ protein
MSSRFPNLTAVAAGLVACGITGCGAAPGRALVAAPAPEVRRALRVCADPNNLPFSNDRLEGFENKIADIVAKDLGVPVEYTWWAQRRGFVRNTLKACDCDVVIGVPTGFDLTLTTRPYYRSSYVFVTRADRRLDLSSLDDPRLRTLAVGVEIIGDDGANSPPAHALARRGIVSNVRGYTVYGDYREDSPPSRIVAAVASGEIDVAIAWGPMAGYFARRQAVPLEVRPVTPRVDLPFLPLTYQISMGVRHGEKPFRDELSAVIERHEPEIEAILDEYGVPHEDDPVAEAPQ